MAGQRITKFHAFTPPNISLKDYLDRCVRVPVAGPVSCVFESLSCLPGCWVSRLTHRSRRSIHKYASCSSECFVLALVYIDRLIQRNNVILSSLNVHRIIITRCVCVPLISYVPFTGCLTPCFFFLVPRDSIMLASKFFDDMYFNNAYYASASC